MKFPDFHLFGEKCLIFQNLLASSCLRLVKRRSICRDLYRCRQGGTVGADNRHRILERLVGQQVLALQDFLHNQVIRFEIIINNCRIILNFTWFASITTLASSSCNTDSRWSRWSLNTSWTHWSFDTNT